MVRVWVSSPRNAYRAFTGKRARDTCKIWGLRHDPEMHKKAAEQDAKGPSAESLARRRAMRFPLKGKLGRDRERNAASSTKQKHALDNTQPSAKFHRSGEMPLWGMRAEML
jgi:hypothetical protein